MKTKNRQLTKAPAGKGSGAAPSTRFSEVANRGLIISCCVALLCAVTGCRLAREDTGTIPREDRLVGAFITTEYIDLFDFDSYISENAERLPGGGILDDENTQKYQGRLYAALVTKTVADETGEMLETGEYVFDNIEGIAYFSYEIIGESGYFASKSDEAISDGHININTGDDTDSRTMEGTIYVTPAAMDVFYVNPVYQSVDGSVYLTSGNGISVSGNARDESQRMTQTLDAAYTVTENGRTKTDDFSVSISVSVMLAPERIVVLQMDTTSNILSRTEYAPGALPEALKPEKNAAYLVVETHKRDMAGNRRVSREIYSDDKENMTTFYAREDGICIERETGIRWPNGSSA
jgi:hypothetical protein